MSPILSPPTSDAEQSTSNAVNAGSLPVRADVNAMALPLSTGVTPDFEIIVPFSCPEITLFANQLAQFYDFLEHPTIKHWRKFTAHVELTRLDAHVVQGSVFPADEKGYDTAFAVYGPVPRDVTTSIKSGGNTTGVVDYLPNLKSIASSSTVGVQQEAIWGDGGIPFPPGIQLDLVPVEVNFPKVRFLIANLTSSSRDSNVTWRVRLNGVVKVSGRNFGAVF